MNTTAVVVVSAVLATAAAAGVSFALRPPADDAAAMKLLDVETRLGDLQRANEELRGALDALRDRPEPVAAAPVQRREAAPVTQEMIAAAVELYLSKRAGRAEAADAAAGGDGGEAAFDLERDFDKLAGTNLWSDSALWRKAFEAGRMDDVIAKFEELAEANPNDPESQMQLARACMSYVQMDQSKWQFSMKADKQFDKVLALDDHHWEARFTKAVSYTFYPDFLGKKKDAIAHFETLIDQQDSMPVQDDQAQTYLYLGNLLAEREPERAAEIWRRGLRRHPNNQELQQKAGQ